jgi:hypothetical protein
MTDMRVTQHCRGKLQPARSFQPLGIQHRSPEARSPAGTGLFVWLLRIGSMPFRVCPCTSTGRPGVHVCRARSADGAGMQRSSARSLARGRVRTQPRGHRLVSSVDQSAGLRSRRPEVRLLHEAPVFISMSRWTSGEVLGPSSRRGGFDSRTGYQTKACRRALASTGANRPQRLGGVGTRHRQPLRASTVCGATGKRICFGSRGVQVRVLLHGPAIHVAIAQLEERRSVEPEVAGSGPAGGAK